MSGPTEKQIVAVESYLKHQNIKTVSEELGISESSVHKHLARYACHAYLKPDRYHQNAPVGFDLKKTTIQIDGNGNVVQEWPRFAPVYVDIEQWISSLEGRVPVVKRIDGPVATHSDLMLEWCLYDHHFGMHAWGRETGADYDIDIAKRLMVGAAERIFGSYGNVCHAVIVLGGDNQHADNRSNRTERSGHSLDSDSRYQKTLWSLYDSAVCSIDLALANAGQVTVMVLSGNHDYHSAIALAGILHAHYRENDRVRIDKSPAKHKFFRWGTNYFMYSHGDTGCTRLGPYLLNHIIDIGETGIKRKLVRIGHLHKRGRTTPPGLTEDDGVVIERFPTLAAPDAYATEEAYSQSRATVATLWHQKWGQRGRLEISAGELLEEAT